MVIQGSKCSKLVIERSKCRTNKNRMSRLFFYKLLGTCFLHGRGIQHYDEEKSKLSTISQIKLFREQGVGRGWGAWAVGRSGTS